MTIVQLLASPFFGGPERQMLGLARHLPCRNVFLSFPEGGDCESFLSHVRRYGFEGRALRWNFPHVRQSVSELAGELRRERADILLTSGYKPNLIGWLAARRVGVPIVAVSHGWTGATRRVRLNETIDRLILRWFDAITCVSEAQAVKVRKAFIPSRKVIVIRNAVAPEAFDPPDPAYVEKLRAFFPEPPRCIIGAAGRMSPEKGYDQLVDAARLVLTQDPGAGFIHFGDGPDRPLIERKIREAGIGRRFILAGFRDDLNRFVPHFDLFVLPSFTEGLPVVLLESFAAGVPAVATAVGGTPEVLEDGKSGYLVPAGRPDELARRILDLIKDHASRQAMGQHARRHVEQHFTFADQAKQYMALFERLRPFGPSRHRL